MIELTEEEKKNNEEKAKAILKMPVIDSSKLDTLEDYLKYLITQQKLIIKALNDINNRLEDKRG